MTRGDHGPNILYLVYRGGIWYNMMSGSEGHKRHASMDFCDFMVYAPLRSVLDGQALPVQHPAKHEQRSHFIK